MKRRTGGHMHDRSASEHDTRVLEATRPPQACAQPQEQPPALELFHLTKVFGRHTAVHDLSLTVQQGEIFGLLGPNGSGKTTTMNLISGLSVPTDGHVRVLGYEVRRQSRQVRQLLGMVPQETALYEELSAWHNLQYHAALYGIPRRERAARVQAMLALVHLRERQHARVSTFSGGMKRRLALARALLHRPRLLSLDEPTLGVDPQNRHALYAFIRALPAQGVTVLLTTNDLHEAQLLCTRVAILDRGVLQVVSTPEQLTGVGHTCQIDLDLDAAAGLSALLQDLRDWPGIGQVEQIGEQRLLVNSNGYDALPDILAWVNAHGCRVRHLGIREPQLEEAFLQVTGSLLRD